MKRNLSRVVLSLFLVAGCKGGEPEQSDDVRPTANDADVVVTIFGEGSVRYDPQPAIDCVGHADNNLGPLPCTPVVFHDGSGSVTAMPAKGWRFNHWGNTLGNLAKQKDAVITNPANPKLVVLQGVHFAVSAYFVKIPTSGDGSQTAPAFGFSTAPIKAEFLGPQVQSTAYRLDIDNPANESITVVWSGPNCGDYTPRDPEVDDAPTQQRHMTWHHPHPDCDASTDHSDVKIVATISSSNKVVECTYQGAETGTGPDCALK